MADEIIRLTREQVREYDRRAIEDYGIPGIVLMENAAKAVVDVALRTLRESNINEVLILCGGGNNGGDGLAIARHFHNHGAKVLIALTSDPSRYKGDALTNWRIVEKMKLPVISAAEFRAHEQLSDGPLVIDAVYGTGLSQPPRDAASLLVVSAEIFLMAPTVIAVDLPSGMDANTGKLHLNWTLRPTKTVTFVAEKPCFADPVARNWAGTIIVADIGAPAELLHVARASRP